MRACGNGKLQIQIFEVEKIFYIFFQEVSISNPTIVCQKDWKKVMGREGGKFVWVLLAYNYSMVESKTGELVTFTLKVIYFNQTCEFGRRTRKGNAWRRNY